jgi:hypothetical protein
MRKEAVVIESEVLSRRDYESRLTEIHVTQKRYPSTRKSGSKK